MKNFTKKALAAVILATIALSSACTQEPQPQEEPPQQETAAQPEETQPEPQPQEEPETTRAAFPFAFTAENIHGNTITEASIGENHLFFVYFWTTWCPACVNSMPGLIEMAEEFADNVTFVTLLGDFDTARDTAIRITDDAPFHTVNARHDELGELMQLVQSGFLPTSVVIDTNGNVIGEQIVGGNMAAMRAAIENALNR